MGSETSVISVWASSGTWAKIASLTSKTASRGPSFAIEKMALACSPTWPTSAKRAVITPASPARRIV
jgi:hypothetical protein